MKKDDFLDAMDRFLGIVYGIAILLFFLVALWSLVGCTRYRYIEVPEIHYLDSIVVRNMRDSIYLHDSIYTSLVSKGDTVFVTKSVTKYKYKEVVKVDTLLSVRTDSVSVPTPIEKTVYQMYRWQRFFFHIGIAVCFAVLCYIVYWLVRKWR